MKKTSAALSREYSIILQDEIPQPHRGKDDKSIGSAPATSLAPTPIPDPNTNPDASGEETGMKKEIKSIVELPRSKFSDEVNVVPVERYRRRKQFEDPDKPFKNYCILERRIVNANGRLTGIHLEVQSEPLCKLLQDLGRPCRLMVNLDTVPIVFKKPYKALFFLLDPLERHLTTEDLDPDLKAEIELLVNFIRSPAGIKNVLDAYASQVDLGKVSFGLLWTLFPPETVVYCNDGTWEECAVVEWAEYESDSADRNVFRIHLLMGYDDGNRYGLVRNLQKILAYPGAVDLTKEHFDIVPLDILPSEERNEIRERLVARGQRYCRIQEKTSSHLAYSGPFWAFDTGYFQRAAENSKRVQINGRVVIDPRAMLRLQLASPPAFVGHNLRLFFKKAKPRKKAKDPYAYPAYPSTLDRDEEPENADPADKLDEMYNQREGLPENLHNAELTDDDYLICQAEIRGFFLEEQQWGSFVLENFSEIEWNSEAFSKLQIPQEKKDIVQNLVTGFDPSRAVDFDDVIKYKGKGLIFLLHGEPGVGKTMTAESIAEHAQLPLYHVTTGQLSTNITELEKELRKIFEFGQRWKAVVLLDEADVLMSQRTLSDLQRNSIVAVFLRLIEYYRGLLFLTTNRLEGFDTAFYNRIHVKIRYPQLDHTARSNIWRNFLAKSQLCQDGYWSDEVYEVLGQLKCNGRDIRNIVRIAHSLVDGGTENTNTLETILTAIKINCSDDSQEKASQIEQMTCQLKELAAKQADCLAAVNETTNDTT